MSMKQTMRMASLLVLIVGLASICQAQGSPDPVGWWKLDETEGTTAVDSSGNGYDATVGADADLNVEGPYGSGINFTGGAASYLELPVGVWNNHIQNTGAYTFCFWYKIDNPGQQHCAFGSNPNRHWQSHLPWDGGSIYFDSQNSRSTVGWQAAWTGEWALWTWQQEPGNGGLKKLYRNDVELGSWNATTDLVERTQIVVGAKHDYIQPTIAMFDDVRFYDVILTVPEIQDVMAGGPVKGPSVNPNPANDEKDVIRDVEITWGSGVYSAGHEVYFGESFEEVDTATVPDAVKGLDDTSYDPGRLTFGKTYYWRVDEVNDAHPDKVWKGDVWQFEVEPAGYPVDADLLTVSASGHIGAEPNVAINGAGLTDGMHGTDAENTMWMTNAATPGQGWLQIDMNEPVKLAGLQIWNHNSTNESGPISAFHLGVKAILIEYSLDGETWVSAGEVELAQAPGAATYKGEVVSLGDVYAKSVKLTIQSGFGTLGLSGLSEVQLLAVPTAATYMAPADGSTVNPMDVVMSWRAGREAAIHQVYLSTDVNAVMDETAPMTEVTDAILVPATDMGMTYYWKVVEVNDVETPSRWASPVLSFVTQDNIVVDDMEAYLMNDNAEGTYIWEVWLDGTEFGTNDPDNGSIVGADPMFGDYRPATGLGRGQSLPMWFDNTGVSKSEVTNQTGFDWSVHGIKTLSLVFQGAVDNTAGQIYAKINGKKFLYDGAADDLASTVWLTWNIDLAGVSGVDNIKEFIIGVEGSNAKGVLYVDDIRVYPLDGEMITPEMPDSANLAGHWDFNEGSGDVVNDVSGNGHNGTVANAAWEAGPVGSALKFDGFSTVATLPAAAWDSIEQEVTLSAWIYVPAGISQTPVNFSVYQDVAVNNSRVLSTHVVYSNGNVYFDAGGDTTGYDRLQKAAPANYGDTWEHWTFIKNANTGDMKIYINGILWHNGTGLTRSMTGVTAFTVGAKNEANWFEGSMDDLRLYNKELSQAEILGLAGRTDPIHKPFE